jgi:6-phosphofructokinase 1
LGGGLAGYADVILIPERPFSRAELVAHVSREKHRGKRGLIIVASEGAAAAGESVQVAHRVPGSPEPDRYGGIAESLARWLEKECSWEARHVVLGHLQRSRSPTTTDRFLTLAMGVEAARMVADKAWGLAAVYREGRVQRAPIDDLMKPARRVTPDHRWVKMAQALGIFI